MEKSFNRILYLLLFLFIGVGCTNVLEGVVNSAGQNEPNHVAETSALGVNDQQQESGEANGHLSTAIATDENQIEQPTPTPSPTPILMTGAVVDGQTGRPVPATISLSNDQGDSATSIATDHNGHFQVQNPNFPLMVKVEVPGYELWEADFASVDALAGNPSARLEIGLAPQVTHGVLSVADTGQPLAGVAATVESQGDTHPVPPNAPGLFELYRLLPHDLMSVVPPEGYLPVGVAFAGGRDFTLALQPRHVIVTVHNSFSGSPVTDGQVSFNQTLNGATDTQGKVILSPVPETGQISILRPGYISTTVDYAGGEAVDVALLPARVQAVIRGSDTGQPLPQAAIYLGDTFFRADDNGYFVFDTLPITPTQLMVKTAGYHRTYAQLSQTGVITGYSPPFSGGEGRWLAPTACAESPQPDGPPWLEITLEPFQAHAIYIPLHYLRSRERMIGYLDFIAATELNAIVVDVKGDFGFIAWDSNVDLVSEIGADEWFTDTWMPLDELVAEDKARNIYTIARLVVFKDNPLAHGKPEWAAVNEDGEVWLDREELGWANPFKEEVWQYNLALAQEVAAFGFDELNFDYLRFPSDGDVGAIVYEEENTLETRTTAVREFMTRLSESLRPYGVFVPAGVFVLTIWVSPDSAMRIGQRIIDVAPQIDYLALMTVPSTFCPGTLC